MFGVDRSPKAPTMPASRTSPALLLLTGLSLTAAALGFPALCVAGLGWVGLSLLGAARPLRLYHLLMVSGIAVATGAEWVWTLLLSAPITVAAVAATVAGPRYRGPGLSLLLQKVQNKRTPTPVVYPWTAAQKSPPTASVLARAPASSPACARTPVAG